MFSTIFYPFLISLILYSSFILLLKFQQGWENGLSLKSLPLLMFSVHPYVFDDKSIGTRKPGVNITIRLQKSPEGATKLKELTFAPSLFYYAPAFSCFCLWNVRACPVVRYIQSSTIILLFIIKPWMCTHGWKEEALLNQVSRLILKPCVIHTSRSDGLSRAPICLLSNPLRGSKADTY